MIALHKWFALSSLAALLLSCTAPNLERGQWSDDWNARVDSNADLMSHPCGDFAFDPWADAFLDGCDQPRTSIEASVKASTEAKTQTECRLRTGWVRERSAQCDGWQTWLLRNSNQHERRSAPEPETRVE